MAERIVALAARLRDAVDPGLEQDARIDAVVGRPVSAGRARAILAELQRLRYRLAAEGLHRRALEEQLAGRAPSWVPGDVDEALEALLRRGLDALAPSADETPAPAAAVGEVRPSGRPNPDEPERGARAPEREG